MEEKGALGLAGAPLFAAGQQFYVNPIMQEKPRFELAPAVEVFVEVVEALQIHGLE